MCPLVHWLMSDADVDVKHLSSALDQDFDGVSQFIDLFSMSEPVHPSQTVKVPI